MPERFKNQQKTPLINLAIFASGTGSNAQNIIEYFKTSDLIKIKLVVCNNPLANVLKIAAVENIQSLLITKDDFFNSDINLRQLQNNTISFIVLAGFLWKIPISIIQAYPNKIINIHPALLPKYGGKNMYGNRVHEAVIHSGDKESGITIHYVDEHYDNGDIIFQAKCNIEENDTAETLAQKIHLLEFQYFPAIIYEVIKTQFRNINFKTIKEHE